MALLVAAASLPHGLPSTNGPPHPSTCSHHLTPPLQVHNARLLGLGGSPDREGRAAAAEEEGGALGPAIAALTRVRLSFPPLPFLPSLPLEVSAQLSCPSKAACEEAEQPQQQQEEEGEGEEEGGGEAPAAGKSGKA